LRINLLLKSLKHERFAACERLDVFAKDGGRLAVDAEEDQPRFAFGTDDSLAIDAIEGERPIIDKVGADGGYSGTWKPSLEVQIIEGGVGDFVFVNGNDEAGKPSLCR
jgi:hypothetical protein